MLFDLTKHKQFQTTQAFRVPAFAVSINKDLKGVVHVKLCNRERERESKGFVNRKIPMEF